MICRQCLSRALRSSAPSRLAQQTRFSVLNETSPVALQATAPSFGPTRHYITHSKLSQGRMGDRVLEAGKQRLPVIGYSGRRSLVTLAKQPEAPEEPDVLKNGEPTIILTERAEKKLKQVSEAENNPHLALRIAVEPGGCHGYQYKMELTDEADEDDFHFQAADGVSLYVDSVSLNLVKGSTIDYVTELIGSQFAIKDNPQAKGAGCGCGVSWEPII